MYLPPLFLVLKGGYRRKTAFFSIFFVRMWGCIYQKVIPKTISIPISIPYFSTFSLKIKCTIYLFLPPVKWYLSAVLVSIRRGVLPFRLFCVYLHIYSVRGGVAVPTGTKKGLKRLV